MIRSELPRILRGNGESPENAVKFESCHLEIRVHAEYEFVCDRFGPEHLRWTEEMHLTSLEQQSVWVIKLEDGTERRVYFETEGTIYDDD